MWNLNWRVQESNKIVTRDGCTSFGLSSQYPFGSNYKCRLESPHCTSRNLARTQGDWEVPIPFPCIQWFSLGHGTETNKSSHLENEKRSQRGLLLSRVKPSGNVLEGIQSYLLYSHLLFMLEREPSGPTFRPRRWIIDLLQPFQWFSDFDSRFRLFILMVPIAETSQGTS